MRKAKEKPAPKIINQAFELVPLTSLKSHPKNPNEGDIGSIHESIDANGFYGAVVAQRSTGYVLAGNHRRKAAEASGLQELPVIWVDVDDERALRILLADNRTARLGHDNESALAELLASLANTEDSLAGTGYSTDDLDDLIADLANNTGLDGTPSSMSPRGGESESQGGLGVGVAAKASKDGQRFGVLVICEDEGEQRDVFEKLSGEDYTVFMQGVPPQ